MGLHDFSTITAQIQYLLPHTHCKKLIIKWSSDITQRCSKVASKHACGHLNACQAAVELLSDLIFVCLIFLHIPPGHGAPLLCTLSSFIHARLPWFASFINCNYFASFR